MEDYGTNGVAWGNDPERVKTARATVANGREDYFRVMAAFWVQLDSFVRETQAK